MLNRQDCISFKQAQAIQMMTMCNPEYVLLQHV